MEDKQVKIEKDGKSRIYYKCLCRGCNIDIGYKREKYYNKSGLCRVCSQRKAKSISDKDKYPNVDFNDSQLYKFNKIKSKGTGERVYYRTKCKFCGQDKGYVRKSLFNTRCYKCTMTTDRKNQLSATQQGIDIRDWEGYI